MNFQELWYVGVVKESSVYYLKSCLKFRCTIMDLTKSEENGDHHECKYGFVFVDDLKSNFTTTKVQQSMAVTNGL